MLPGESLQAFVSYTPTVVESISVDYFYLKCSGAPGETRLKVTGRCEGQGHGCHRKIKVLSGELGSVTFLSKSYFLFVHRSQGVVVLLCGGLWFREGGRSGRADGGDHQFLAGRSCLSNGLGRRQAQRVQRSASEWRHTAQWQGLTEGGLQAHASHHTSQEGGLSHPAQGRRNTHTPSLSACSVFTHNPLLQEPVFLDLIGTCHSKLQQPTVLKPEHLLQCYQQPDSQPSGVQPGRGSGPEQPSVLCLLEEVVKQPANLLILSYAWKQPISSQTLVMCCRLPTESRQCLGLVHFSRAAVFPGHPGLHQCCLLCCGFVDFTHDCCSQ